MSDNVSKIGESEKVDIFQPFAEELQTPEQLAEITERLDLKDRFSGLCELDDEFNELIGNMDEYERLSYLMTLGMDGTILAQMASKQVSDIKMGGAGDIFNLDFNLMVSLTNSNFKDLIFPDEGSLSSTGHRFISLMLDVTQNQKRYHEGGVYDILNTSEFYKGSLEFNSNGEVTRDVYDPEADITYSESIGLGELFLKFQELKYSLLANKKWVEEDQRTNDFLLFSELSSYADGNVFSNSQTTSKIFRDLQQLESREVSEAEYAQSERGAAHFEPASYTVTNINDINEALKKEPNYVLHSLMIRVYEKTVLWDKERFVYRNLMAQKLQDDGFLPNLESQLKFMYEFWIRQEQYLDIAETTIKFDESLLDELRNYTVES